MSDLADSSRRAEDALASSSLVADASLSRRCSSCLRPACYSALTSSSRRVDASALGRL